MNAALLYMNFPKKSKVPLWLKEIILSSSEDHLRKFLVFVTGSPSISSTSSRKVEINVRCQPRSGALPVAHTCFFHLGEKRFVKSCGCLFKLIPSMVWCAVCSVLQCSGVALFSDRMTVFAQSESPHAIRRFWVTHIWRTDPLFISTIIRHTRLQGQRNFDEQTYICRGPRDNIRNCIILSILRCATSRMQIRTGPTSRSNELKAFHFFLHYIKCTLPHTSHYCRDDILWYAPASPVGILHENVSAVPSHRNDCCIDSEDELHADEIMIWNIWSAGLSIGRTRVAITYSVNLNSS